MNKTIKIIELFNKMASFDEQKNLPEKIKYRNCIFRKIYGEGISPDYMNENSDCILEYVAVQADDLNEKVEIIEEENKMDIQSLEDCSIRYYQGFIKNLDYIEAKINELLQAVKQLDITKEDKQCK